MATAGVRFVDLQDDLPFGTRVIGATRRNLQKPSTSNVIRQVFEERGLLIFEDVEQSPQMQLAISEILGELKDHPVPSVSRANEDLAAGVIELKSDPEDGQIILQADGHILHNWIPWHFDHAYNNELNRAGVLRPITIAPTGGLTGFADGIDMYKRLSPELRQKIEGRNVIYHLASMITNLRYGRPTDFRIIQTCEASNKVLAEGLTKPRAVHPAVWTRRTGEKVLHVGALSAVGIEGLEGDPKADELLEKVCQEIRANTNAYFHRWKIGQMLTWDNWRILHCVTGTDPINARLMHRTTIKGDYGLGRFEDKMKIADSLQAAN